jgi:hypothetical protein
MDYINEKNISIDNIHFDIKHNISSISTNVHNSIKKFTFHNEPIDETNLNIYFILETPHQAAFGHWVFESSIFLPYFNSFKNAKLLVNKNPTKKYKSLFFKLFNITEDNIVYLDNAYDESVEYKDIPKNNICIIPRHTAICHTLKDDIIDRINIFMNLLSTFKHVIINNDYTYDKEIEHLFLPRNTIENYTQNERSFDYSKIYKILEDKDYISYNTMDTEDMHKQIVLISKAKNIYLDYGSAFVVNGFFSKNSNIYVNNKNHYQYNTFIIGKRIIDFIEIDNKVIYI